MSGESSNRSGTGPDPAGIVVAAILAILAAILAWDVSAQRLTSTYGIGPTAMPIVIAVGLGLLSVGNLVVAFREGHPRRETLDGKAILLILGGLAVLIAMIGIGGGFIIGTAVLFAATAAAFGRRAPFVDLAIGFGLAVVIYILFAKLLTLSLPVGPLENLI